MSNYTYFFSPIHNNEDNYLQYLAKIDGDHIIYIRFNETQPNMVIEYLNAITKKFIHEDSINAFFTELDIAKNVISILNILENHLDNRITDRIIIIDQLNVVFSDYIVSPLKSWKRDVLQQWLDFLENIILLNVKGQIETSIILISDYKVSYDFIEKNFIKMKKSGNDQISIKISRINSKSTGSSPSMKQNKDYKLYEKDIKSIIDIYKSYLRSKKKENNNNLIRILVSNLCASRGDFLFYDRGFLLQEYGYNKLLLEILHYIGNEKYQYQNDYYLYRLKILEGNLNYYNYPEDYYRALGCYHDVLRKILKNDRKCFNPGSDKGRGQKCKRCCILEDLIYNELISVLYHVVIDDKLKYLNDHEKNLYYELLRKILTNFTKRKQLIHKRQVTLDQKLFLYILIICEKIFYEMKRITVHHEMIKSDQKHKDCLYYNDNTNDKQKVDSYNEREIIAARFIVVCMKLSEILSMKNYEPFNFIIRVLDNKFKYIFVPNRYIIKTFRWYSFFNKTKFGIIINIHRITWYTKKFTLFAIKRILNSKYYLSFDLYRCHRTLKKLNKILSASEKQYKKFNKNEFWRFLIFFHSIDIIKTTLNHEIINLNHFKEQQVSDLRLLNHIKLDLYKNSIYNTINKLINSISKIQKSLTKLENKGLKTWRSARLDEIHGDLIKMQLTQDSLLAKEKFDFNKDIIKKYNDAKMKYIRINSYNYAERIDNKIGTFYKRISQELNV